MDKAQHELECWLIKNQPQVQYMLQNNNIKELLLQVYQHAQAQVKAVPITEEELKDLVEDRLSDEVLTDYSDLLIKNL